MSRHLDKKIWEERIQDYRNSGISLAAWCRIHEISLTSMKYHLHGRKSKGLENDKLLPVVVQPSLPADDHIEITFGSFTIKVTDSTNITLLKKVMGELS